MTEPKPLTVHPAIAELAVEVGILMVAVTADTVSFDGHGTLADTTPWGIPGREFWPLLDLANAWVDRGPSPAGNPGPYLKVPYPDEEAVHRLYPIYQPGDVIRLEWGNPAFVAKLPSFGFPVVSVEPWNMDTPWPSKEVGEAVFKACQESGLDWRGWNWAIKDGRVAG